jgi:outer membrane cobalamin receptor
MLLPSRPRFIAASVALGLTIVTRGVVAQTSGDSTTKKAPTLLDAAVVTATRTSQTLETVPTNVDVLGPQQIHATAAKTTADLLRVVPGFVMKDFQSTLVSHPSRQTPSLRGLGGTSASRTLVLLDGVPINDPFAGWVHWSRIPLPLVQRAEVVRSGGAGVWGDRALSGVINLITADPTTSSMQVSASGGSNGTVHGSAVGTFRRAKLGALFAGDYAATDGYVTARADQRGPIDTPADSRDEVFYGKLLYNVTPLFRVFASGSYMDDFRHNGTVLKTDGTKIGDLRAGAQLVTAGGSRIVANTYVSHTKHQNYFSNDALDRKSEVPSLNQFDVPNTALGLQVQWSKMLVERHELSAGIDVSRVDGEVNEDFNYVANQFTRRRLVSGRQLLMGAYLQESADLGRGFHLLASGRIDRWANRDALRVERDLTRNVNLIDSSFAGSSDSQFSFTTGLRHQIVPAVAWRTSLYTSFRSPTLNELYKPFREPGNLVTEANSGLKAERLFGADLGADFALGPSALARLTAFWNRVDDPIYETTVAPAPPGGGNVAPCGFIPAGGVCRQRNNLEQYLTKGIEAEVEARPTRTLTLRGSYLFNPTRIEKAARAPSIVGLEGKGTARQQFSASVAYDNPSVVDLAITTRYVGRRFEDDQNLLALPSFSTTDVYVSRRVTRQTGLFFSVENVLDREYAVTHASNGFIRIGTPRWFDGGVRYQW